MNDFTYAITKSEFCDFADDNTIYACSQNLEHVVSCLKDGTFIMSNFNYCPLVWMFCGKDAMCQ